MVIETVVTTINPDGSVNCGAMGVEWGEARIVIKPYAGTRTLRNLRATGAAVVNLTDDILLFSQAALAAGLDGVRRACEPPPPVDGDVYALAESAAPPLPATLAEATDLLERSALARDWLGDDVVDHCVAMRRAELAAQAAAVTDWETARYLEAL